MPSILRMLDIVTVLSMGITGGCNRPIVWRTAMRCRRFRPFSKVPDNKFHRWPSPASTAGGTGER